MKRSGWTGIIKQAEKGIRFIDPRYKELFRIPDGDPIRIQYQDGTHSDRTCRYIDEYHVEVGSGWNSLLHICQFAEMMERNGSTVIPLRSSCRSSAMGFCPTQESLLLSRKANPDITGQMLLQPVKRKPAPLRMSTMGKRG